MSTWWAPDPIEEERRLNNLSYHSGAGVKQRREDDRQRKADSKAQSDAYLNEMRAAGPPKAPRRPDSVSLPLADDAGTGEGLLSRGKGWASAALHRANEVLGRV